MGRGGFLRALSSSSSGGSRDPETDRRAVAHSLSLDLGTAADPLLAALVELLLPERHLAFERVDCFLARGKCVLPVWRRDGDHDAGLADPDPARAVVDRDLAEVVTALQVLSDFRHGLFSHFLVGLV